MKSLAFFAAALAVGQAAALPSNAMSEVLRRIEKRQGVGALFNGVVNPKGGRVAVPANAGPARVELQSRVTIPGAKTTKLRYGPYKVPNMKYTNMLGEEGALWNYADNVAPKPCDMCTIVGISAGLEYPNGKNANLDTGLWLHHMVLFTIGPGRQDATCMTSPISLPHMIVGSSALGSERFFSSGNERTKAILPLWNVTNAGYKLKSADKFALIVDLMNENMEDAVVYLTMTYDYIPGHPADYDDIRPVWFDVAQCLTSEWPPPKLEGQYTIPSSIWTANFEGEVVGAAGHLHDGGQSVTLEVDGTQVCRSSATYGGAPEWYSKPMANHGNTGATEHLSKMSICVGPTLGIKKLVKGQKWKLRADYDYGKNKGNFHGKKASNVMGISIMFARVKQR